ncbi:MAG: GNAT family N-acetyltransferase [Elusimicrobia bacterium]|nr:GNAT family N-acetyltransferase [Elusimicrobiota bacterium]
MISVVAIRLMKPEESAVFAGWEAAERPYPWTARQFDDTAAAPASTVLVMEENGAALGFAAVQRVEDEAYLLNIMIAPEVRRRGFGEILLQKVMIWSREQGARRLVLDVDAGNAPALRLYAKAGFETLERRPRSYPRGENALVMKKDL